MNKAGLWICITVAIGVVMCVAVFRGGEPSVSIVEMQAPIVDPTCGPGYELVGEGCMPANEACELQGDGYYFDEKTQECLQNR